jgi:WD40 repeat protein
LGCSVVVFFFAYQSAMAKENLLTARRYSYVVDMNRAQRDWEDNEMIRVLELLKGQRPEFTGENDLRGFEWYYLSRQCDADLLRITADPLYILGVSFSPDGERLATAGTDKMVKIWGAHTGKKLMTLEGHTEQVNSVVFSPNGEYLATGSGDVREGIPDKPGEVIIWSARTGKKLHMLMGHTGFISQVAWSRDSKLLASASKDKTVKIWDPLKGREIDTIRGHQGLVDSVAFSGDGQYLASASADGKVMIWDIGGQALRHTLVLPRQL